MVLVDLLESYFDKHKNEIEKNLPKPFPADLSRIAKIHLLVQYLLDKPENIELLEDNLGVKFDRETLEILQLHLKNSADKLEDFIQRIENWFDDSMNRVSGWYKRQTQVILFGLGLALAIAFNVDIIGITGKLSTDKDARDKLVEMAIKAADSYKDDPRVKRLESEIANASTETVTPADSIATDTTAVVAQKVTVAKDQQQKTLDSLKADYEKYRKEAKDLIEGDIASANNLMALGWGNYGGAKTNWKKMGYIWYNCIEGTRPIGYLLFAFGICLGAPFWFDLLQKLIRIRSAGKKEDTASTPDPKTKPV